MKAVLLLVSVALVLSTGCKRPTAARAPTGVVYEGKHISEWGDQLTSPDEPTRLQAAKTLVKAGKEGHSTKDALQALEAAVTDASAAVRGWSAVGLAYAARGTPFPFVNKPDPVAALKEAAESADEELRAEASELQKQMIRPGRGGGKGPGKGKEPPADPEPGAKEPGAKEPAAKEPGAKEPGAKEPGAKEPAAKEPAGKAPAEGGKKDP